jgi:hypothetical protein
MRMHASRSICSRSDSFSMNTHRDQRATTPTRWGVRYGDVDGRLQPMRRPRVVASVAQGLRKTRRPGVLVRSCGCRTTFAG